jgi:phenylalanyl-tRNA synthetase alpha chain
MFHQMEALVVDENIGLGEMKGVIAHFLRLMFGAEQKIRLRPSFFPFVEPGAEVDMQCVACKGKGCRICKETGWLEIGGCGLVHPHVFEAVGYDSERWSGFAFGFGLDRMAMLKFDLKDLRILFEGYAPFLAQFPALRIALR